MSPDDPSGASPSEPDAAAATSPSIRITVSNSSDDDGEASNGTKLQSVIQPDQPNLSKPKFFDFRERALRKGSEVLGNSIKGLYSKLESDGFNAGEGMCICV